MVVARETRHADLEQAIREAGGTLLVRVRLFDLFEGASLGTGKKSMAYALEFRSPERTLADREVEAALGSIIRMLESKFGAALRGARQTVSGEIAS